jgi:hypothetical protein
MTDALKQVIGRIRVKAPRSASSAAAATAKCRHDSCVAIAAFDARPVVKREKTNPGPSLSHGEVLLFRATDPNGYFADTLTLILLCRRK